MNNKSYKKKKSLKFKITKGVILLVTSSVLSLGVISSLLSYYSTIYTLKDCMISEVS